MQYSQVYKKRICLPLTVFVGREKPLTSGLKLIFPSNNIVSENKYYHAACPASYFDKRTNHTKQLSEVSSNPLHPATHFLSKKKKCITQGLYFFCTNNFFVSVPKKKKKERKQLFICSFPWFSFSLCILSKQRSHLHTFDYIRIKASLYYICFPSTANTDCKTGNT